MIFVPREATNDEVLDIVRNWLDVLATADYEAAFAAITCDFEGETWTPHFLKIAVEGYRSPEYYPGVESFQVTDWRMAKGGNPEARQEITWYRTDSGLAGSVIFDLPLNGQWSDLLTEFDIWLNGDSDEGYLLCLDEIGSWEQRQREWEAEEQFTKE